MSFDRAAYIRNYSKQVYHKRRSEGLCTRCGKVPARAGKVMCEECAQKASARSRRRYALKPRCTKRTENYKKLLKAVADDPALFAEAMNRHCEGGCIMDMFGDSGRCGRYQDQTCHDCIRDWLGEEGQEHDEQGAAGNH